MTNVLSFINLTTTLKKSIERTSRWAERGLKAHRRPHDQGLFGIVQGLDLKIFAVNQLTTLSAWTSQATLSVVLAVGETHEEMNAVLDFTTQLLPENKPRYLMGVGRQIA